MKRLFLLTALFLTFNVYTQTPEIFPVEDGEVIIKEVIDLGEQYTDEEIFQAVKDWSNSPSAKLYRKIGGEKTGIGMLFGGGYDSSMATLEANYRTLDPFISESAGKRINLRLTQHYQSGGSAAFIRTLFVNSVLRIDIKDGKYRYTLSGFQYEHWNHFTGEQQSMWNMGKHKKLCGRSGTIATLQNLCTKGAKSRIKTLNALRDDIDAFILNMKDEIENNINLNLEDDIW